MPKGPFTEFEVRTPSGRVMSPYAVQLFPAGDGASMKESLDIPPPRSPSK